MFNAKDFHTRMRGCVTETDTCVTGSCNCMEGIRNCEKWHGNDGNTCGAVIDSPACTVGAVIRMAAEMLA